MNVISNLRTMKRRLACMEVVARTCYVLCSVLSALFLLLPVKLGMLDGRACLIRLSVYIGQRFQMLLHCGTHIVCDYKSLGIGHRTYYFARHKAVGEGVKASRASRRHQESRFGTSGIFGVSHQRAESGRIAAGRRSCGERTARSYVDTRGLFGNDFCLETHGYEYMQACLQRSCVLPWDSSKWALKIVC